MNNEPVAWIIDANMTDCDDNFIWNTGGYPDWQVKDWIPLYTHPADLTDEEIYEIWWQADVASDYYRDSKEFGIEFARAILRKAQEK